MSLARRLWIYQASRFPLAKNLPLLAVFSAASLSVSAHLAGRPLPDVAAFAAAFGLAVILFFQLRAADEWKDHAVDLHARPERPIPSGVIGLSTILRLAAALGLPALLLAWSQDVVWLLLLAWAWMAAMTLEFGARDWLRRHPVATLLSHMMIIPLIDLLLTGVEWRGGGAAPALGWFLALSFFNGCVLEIGRKCWAPESERPGVESYSANWGLRRAVLAWGACLACAAGCLIGLGLAFDARLSLPLVSPAFVMAGLAGLGLAAGAAIAGWLAAAPRKAGEKALDAASGLWILTCYACAGGLPLLGDI